MDALAGNIAQDGVDHPLALQARDAGETRAFDQDREMRFAAAVVAGVAVVVRGIVDDFQVGWGKCGIEKLPHFLCDRSSHGFHLDALVSILKPVKHGRFHGRHESRGRECNWPGCEEAGEYRAPGPRPSSSDGPGDYRWFCLDHVREFNAGYDYFDGMDAEAILRAQSPLHGWEAQSRAFRPDAGIDGVPRWADFSDPLEAISSRARAHVRHRQAAVTPESQRFTPNERRALDVLGLDANVDRRGLRQRYTRLLRKYHPDHNGGDRSHEARLQIVVQAYQLLRRAAAFA